MIGLGSWSRALRGVPRGMNNFVGRYLGPLTKPPNLLRGEMETMRRGVRSEMISLQEKHQEEIKAVKGEIALCKLAVSQGVVNAQVAPQIDIS